MHSIEASLSLGHEAPLYPMWVMALEDFLNIDIVEPHEACLQRGQLHNPSTTDTVLFVSHQWMSSSHPDASGEQIRVLKTVSGI
jgi:hypothetical protein